MLLACLHLLMDLFVNIHSMVFHWESLSVTYHTYRETFDKMVSSLEHYTSLAGPFKFSNSTKPMTNWKSLKSLLLKNVKYYTFFGDVGSDSISRGILIHQNGKVVFGHWKQAQRYGPSRCIMPNYCVESDMKADISHGKSTIYLKDSTTRQGVFFEGKFVGKWKFYNKDLQLDKIIENPTWKDILG